jgi:spore coat polysaccharide biosynthesis predicted glycosyltransferase SpsG
MQKFEAGAGSVITVVDDRHLGWFIDELGNPVPDYTARVNRQMLPAHFRESGAIIAARIKDVLTQGTRIVQPIALIELGQDESLDIDTWADWAVAEHFATRRKIFVRTDAAKSLGMGHVYRTLALVQALARHEITIVLSADKPLGLQFFTDYPFTVVQVNNDDEFVNLTQSHKPDLVVLDQLDTSAELVTALKLNSKVATFEDLGPGAEVADLLIADLYVNEKVEPNKQLTGVENSILAPNFESLPRQREFRDLVETVLVLFGGTDPSHLADKALRALEVMKFAGRVIVVRGLGADALEANDYALQIEMMQNVKNMPSVMQQADLALSSAGRTITELSCMGVPTLCLAQNTKEMSHTHTTKENGVLMLGLGSAITVEDLASKLENVISNAALRKSLQQSALQSTAERSNEKIVDRIMHKLEL